MSRNTSAESKLEINLACKLCKLLSVVGSLVVREEFTTVTAPALKRCAQCTSHTVASHLPSSYPSIPSLDISGLNPNMRIDLSSMRHTSLVSQPQRASITSSLAHSTHPAVPTRESSLGFCKLSSLVLGNHYVANLLELFWINISVGKLLAANLLLLRGAGVAATLRFPHAQMWNRPSDQGGGVSPHFGAVVGMQA